MSSAAISLSSADRAALLAALDVLAPPPFDVDVVFTAIGYVPTERQRAFHDAREWDVLYGGAAGGGKTAALVADDIADCVRYPGLRVGAFRRTYDELAESMLKQLALFDFAQALGATWNGSERELRFANTSVIRYRYAETVVDATRRQGGEYQKITVDERTLMLPTVVELLVERMRSGRVEVPVIGVRSATNPGGPGHGAVRTRFIDPTRRGRVVAADKQGRSVRFIPAKVSDNPHVDVGYLKVLDAIPDPNRRAAMRDGDWDSFAGMAFPEWRRETVLVAPFALPESWQRHVGIDYGYAAPWVAVFAARDGDGRMWVFDLLTGTQVTEGEQARAILAAEASHRVLHADPDHPDRDTVVAVTEVGLRVADPAMWAKTGTAMSVAAQYALEGVHLMKADNDRLVGKARVHTYLRNGPACAAHREQGLNLCPLLHLFDTPTVAYLADSLGSLPTDPRRPEDVDTNANDHAYDALRYLLMSVGTVSQLVVGDDPPPPRALDGSTFNVPFAGRFALDPKETAVDDTQRAQVQRAPWAS